MNLKTTQKGMSARIVAIRDALGVTQRQLASRAEVRPKQVTAWVKGTSSPSLNKRENWARREGWPIRIFDADGPDPVIVIAEARRRSVDAAVTGLGDFGDPLAQEIAPMIAHDVGKAIAHQIRKGELDRSRAGIEFLAQALTELAIRFTDNGDENGEILRAAERLRKTKI